MPGRSLLTRCRKGEQAALTELFNSYVHAVYRWALFFGIDESGAEEVAQEVFITAMGKISKCRSDKHLPPWLFHITRGHASNYRRRAWFRKMFRTNGAKPEQPEVESNPGPVQSHPGLSYDLQRILKKIPIKLTEILIMHDMDGYSQAEIATILALPKGTVASRLRKARATLKQEWR
ncbi:MAG: RNA polymerase sigma factor [Proteobacteria bacterium]|nr:RNA polymerase sigma factor [Pseudomonadota bacterium]